MKKPVTKILENGLRVLVVPIPGALTTTVLSAVNTGSYFESEKENGISHFLEHMCFKGTKKMSGKEIMRYLDGLGAETNAFTSREYTGYYVKSVKKHWKKSLAVVADIFLNSEFPEEELEKERGVILGEIGMYKDIPHHRAFDFFQRVLYGNQPAGRTILGPQKNIKSFTRQDFLDYHTKHYVADNTVVMIAGDVNPKEAIAEIEKHYTDIATGKSPKQPKIDTKQKKMRFELERKKYDQSHIVLGYRGLKRGHKDYLVAFLLARVLGGGMSSRLSENMREDRGLGYYVGSRFSTNKDDGVLYVSCGVDPKRIDEAGQAIQDEIKRLRDELVPEKELKKTKEFATGNFLMNLESSEELGHYYLTKFLFGLPLDRPKEYVKKIRAITDKDLRRVARKMFTKDRLNVAIIGPHSETETKKIKKSFSL
jgi:predicted Zn-dependent peptidase